MYAYGDVRLKLEITIHKKRNWILVPLVDISLDMPKGIKGYRFYYPSNSTRIVESRNTKFLENNLISEGDQFQNTNSVKDRPSTSSEILIIIHNTPQVQLRVEQPINEIPQAAENVFIDQDVHQVI